MQNKNIFPRNAIPVEPIRRPWHPNSTIISLQMQLNGLKRCVTMLREERDMFVSRNKVLEL